MKKLLFIFVLASFGLTACGVKGPLYFPEQTPPQTETEQ
ncbi:lipoprotein [Glaesserella sp.]